MTKRRKEKRWEPAFHACLLALGPPPKVRILRDAALIGQYRVDVRIFWLQWHSHQDTQPKYKSQMKFMRAYMNWVEDQRMKQHLYDNYGIGEVQ